VLVPSFLEVWFHTFDPMYFLFQRIRGIAVCGHEQPRR
jgi:hypothetical protein